MSNHEKKQKRSIWLVALLLLLLLAAIAAVIYFFTPWFGGSEPTEPTETVPLDTSVPDETDEEVILYYNVDREQYAGKGEDGLTSRPKDPDTGYYHITFAAKGRVAARRVIDRRIATKIDNQEVMSLVLDESGIVTDLITVDKCTGGYWMLGKHMFVTATNGYMLTLYGNEEMKGSAYTLEYTADTRVYDVSEFAAENGTQGQVSTIQEGDELLVILNKDGSVGWIYVVGRVKPVVTRTHWCDHCQQEVAWIEWEKDNALPAEGEGHYYLAQDVTLPKQASMEKNANIVLDLNGHLVTGKAGNRVYSLHNEGTYLAIMDYSEAQTGVIRPAATTSTTNQGGCVWVRYGEFELYGGTLDASGYTGNTNGMAVNVSKNTTFRMHGGTVIGGTSQACYNAEKRAYQQGFGGAVSVNGTFEMNGGTITGGKAEPLYVDGNVKMGAGGNVYCGTSSTFTMNGGVIKNGWTIAGGNVYVSGKATFNMNGGVIRDGSAVNAAGNLDLASNATANISGGEIVNGETTGKGKNGGSIYVTSNSTLNMYGGWVYGGTSRNCGGNMVVYGTFNMYGGNISNGRILDYETGKEKVSTSANIFVVNSTMNMYGGEVNGHLQLINTTGKEFKMTVSGTAKITKSKDDAASLYIPSGKTIEVGELKDGAEIYVTASGFFSGETLEKNKNYIHSDKDGVETGYFDKCLFFGRVQCYCGASVNGGEHIGDCDGTLHAFSAWTNTKSLPTTEGCYYLATDVKMTGQAQIKTNATVALDLNGHSVTGKDGVRVYALWKDCKAKLYITDSTREKSGKISISGEGTNQGSLFWFYGTDHTLTIYDGKFDASGVTLSGNSGAAINAAASGTTINMYGGKLTAGTATVNEKFKGGGGGAVYLKNSTLNLYGGEITGGKAATGGGNIYVDAKATLNIYGGTVSGGAATSYKNAEDKTVNGLGGNIFIAGSNATVNLSGGLVHCGYAAGNGGNVKVTKGGILNVSGGTITGGSTRDSGGNVVLYGTMNMTGGEISYGVKFDANNKEITNVQTNIFVVNGTLNMSGGTIDGHMNLYGTHEVSLSGTAKIKATDGGTSLNINTEKKINVGKMADGAEVYVNTSGIFTTETDEANAKYFHSDDAAQNVSYYQGCLAVGRMQCLCGASVSGGEHIGDCDGELLLFTAWTKTDSLPNTTGNYYLTKNVTLTGQTQVKTDATIALDLNGYTVKGKDGVRVYALWKDCKATLSITDSFKEKSGAITIGGSGTNQGMLFWFHGTNHTLNLYGGTFDASAATLTGNSGTAINAGANGSTVNMYGGTLIGGKAAANEKGSGGMGGAVYVGSGATFNMTGGWIYGGTATGNGGNVYVDGTMTLGKNAVISNGTANGGGNILIGGKATLTTDGGEILDGTATGNGGNIDVLNGGKANLKNTLLSTGSAARGGNLAVFGTATLTGGKLKATETTADGHNLFIYNSGNVTLDGTEVTSPKSGKFGITLSGEAGKTPTLTIKGDTVITENAIVLQDKASPVLNIEGGTLTCSGSNAINLTGSGTPKMTMTGGTIDSSSGGRAIIVQKGSATISGGKVKGGTLTKDNGAGIYVAKDATLKVNGTAEITGGNAASGGNIYAVGGSTLEIGGDAKITNGTATSYKNSEEKTVGGLGGNIYAKSFTMNGGTISDGSATGNGGNVYVWGEVTLTDGTISGGKSIGGVGGNLALDGTMTMSDGAISGGETTGKGKNGGSVYIGTNATFNLNGGTISGGTTRNCGGNIYVGGTMKMTGGTVTGGKVLNYTTGADETKGSKNANIFVVNNAVFEMSGGTVDGHIQLIQESDKTLTATISGTAKIKATDGGTSLYIPTNVKLNVGTMADGAEVYVTATEIFSNTTNEANAKYFHSDNELETVSYYTNCLAIGRAQCICGASLNGGDHVTHVTGCDGTLHLFKAWTSDTTLPTSTGYYYLTKDVNMNGQSQVKSNANIVLDLNGKTVTGKDGQRIYALWDRDNTKVTEVQYSSTLTIADSSKEQTGTMIAKNSGTTQGGIVWFYGKHTLNLYGGTFDASTATVASNGATAIDITAAGSVFNMYGGTIKGGTATATLNAKNNPTGGQGGTIRVAGTGTVFNMTGGTIVGGTANSVTVGTEAKNGQGGAVYVGSGAKLNMSGDAKIENGSATQSGGNVYVDGGTVTVSGSAEIANGTATVTGGNVRVNSGTFTLDGGTVTGGKTTGTKDSHGGNVYIAASGTFELKSGTVENGTAGNQGGNFWNFGTITMTGGKISGGKAETKSMRGANITMTKTSSSVSVFTMSGGEIDGHVALGTIVSGNFPTVTLSGTAKVKASDGGTSLYIPSGCKINVGIEGGAQMADGAEVYVTATEIFSNTTNEANAKYFHSDNELETVSYYTNCLAIGRAQCICGASLNGGDHVTHVTGCDGTLHLFKAWTSDTTLPDSTGYYYLTKNVNPTAQANVNTNGNIVLDLNGKTVTGASGIRLYSLGTTGGATLTISDSVGNGKMLTYAKSVSGNACQGGIVWFRGNNHTLNLYGGTFDASGVTGYTTGGAAIYAGTSGSTINMSGGTIKGGTTTGAGGAVYLKNATFNMYGDAKIEGGSAKKGGSSVYVGESATFTMNGGAITATAANAINLSGANAKFTMSGGEISTSADTAICIDGANASFTMTNGTIDSSSGGRAIIVQKGSATISGGTVKGGTTTGDAYGGSIYVNSGAKLTLNGNALVTGGKSAIGGNIYACADATVEIGGDAKITDGTATSYKKSDETVGGIGGNIYAKSFTMTGGTISGGMANVNGGNVYAYGTVTLSGGTISNGTATGNGGNIYASNGQFSLTGGTISGGSAHHGGGNVYCNGTFKMSGGTISGGSAPTGGNIYADGNAVVTLSGTASVNGGMTTGSGGNIFVQTNATLKMEGGTVGGGQAANGGNIYAVGTLNVNGGTIKDGTAIGNGGNVYVAEKATLTLQGGTVENGNAYAGGNVYLASKSKTEYATLTMYGDAVITGGTATISDTKKDANGGNVNIQHYAQFIMNGGSVTNGNAQNQGGNFWNFGKITMTGGMISGGKVNGDTTADGANIAITALKNSESTLYMNGGTIDGGVNLTAYKALPNCMIGGTAKLLGVRLSTGDGGSPFVTIAEGFTGSLKVTANVTNPAGYVIAKANADNFSSNITVENTGYFAFYESGEYKLYSSASYRAQCVCGASLTAGADHIGNCDETLHLFTAWTSDTTLPTSAGYYYYLTNNVTLSAQQTVTGGGTLCLDLNGYTVTGEEGKRIYSLQNDAVKTLSIADSSSAKTGKMIAGAAGDNANEGRIVWLRGKAHTLNIYGGTLDASTINSTEYAMNGVAINATVFGATINMFGGTVKGGTTQSDYGGAIHLNSGAILNMSGGTIVGGSVKLGGGAISVLGTSKVIMTGGTISGGKVENGGGNILLSGSATFTMSGNAKIEGGSTTGTKDSHGGNIWVSKETTFEMYGGTISDGSAANFGGNLAVYGTLKMSGGEIKDGMSNKTNTGTNYANIFIVNATLEMSGGTIDGHVAVTPTKENACTLKLSGNAKLISSDGTSGITLGKTDSYVTSVVLDSGFTGKVLLNPNVYTQGRVIATSTNGTLADGETPNIVVGNADYKATFTASATEGEAGTYTLTAE